MMRRRIARATMRRKGCEKQRKMEKRKERERNSETQVTDRESKGEIKRECV